MRKATNLPISDFMKRFPPTRMAETMMAISPSGAMPSMTLSARVMDVARNCFVTSSPKSVRRGARLMNALFSKLLESTLVELFDMLSPASLTLGRSVQYMKGFLGRGFRLVTNNM